MGQVGCFLRGPPRRPHCPWISSDCVSRSGSADIPLRAPMGVQGAVSRLSELAVAIRPGRPAVLRGVSWSGRRCRRPRRLLDWRAMYGFCSVRRSVAPYRRRRPSRSRICAVGMLAASSSLKPTGDVDRVRWRDAGALVAAVSTMRGVHGGGNAAPAVSNRGAFLVPMWIASVAAGWNSSRRGCRVLCVVLCGAVAVARREQPSRGVNRDEYLSSLTRA